ncbi:MAG: hypothetical protein AB1486_25660 [Planctomycetota bacterium]
MAWHRSHGTLAGIDAPSLFATLPPAILTLAILALPIMALAGCGTGGGGGDDANAFGGNLSDPEIPVKGPGGTYSRTPKAANQGNGNPALAPPTYPAAIQSNQNHWIRLDFPFQVDSRSIMDPDVLYAPFSYLTGNITITDENGNHVPGIPIVNGRDVFGTDRTQDDGWPEDLSGTGRDRNARAQFVYIATFPKKDVQGSELASRAAFGGTDTDSDQDPTTTDIRELRITVNEVNGSKIDAFWTIFVGVPDTTTPNLVLFQAQKPVPGQDTINGLPSAEIDSTFLVQFNEPLVPQSVSLSARFNPDTYKGNMPPFTWPNPPQPPLPTITISAPTQATPPGGGGRVPTPVYLPFDCNPVNTNNLTKYVLRPLISLPPDVQIDFVVRVKSANQPNVAMDLRGNSFQAGADFTKSYTSGPGPAWVNAPVSPEVLWWTPASGKGLGAIDLNGEGFTTNTPNAFTDASLWGDEITRTAIITDTGHLNVALGRARDGTPQSPAGSPCTGFLNNMYIYPVGTGSAALAYQTGKNDPGAPGNPGTPVPGVNEKSSGFETLVRNSSGEVSLTGGGKGLIGSATDLTAGMVLDMVFFDTVNPYNRNGPRRYSFMNGAYTDRNSIADPPTPNPPPLRYAVGMQPLGFTLDLGDPEDPVGLLIEGEEVFGMAGGGDGFGLPCGLSRIMLTINTVDRLNGPDEYQPPYFVNGPTPQSATAPLGTVPSWSARQQIGNYLYVCDQTNNLLHCVNSNTMRIVTSIALPDPWGVGIAPNLKHLYVSNFGDDSVSVVGTDPREVGFHEEIDRIPVGNGPRAVSVQPDYEDVFVCCWVGDTIDIIDPGTAQIRKSLTALVNKPYDVVLSDRQMLWGFQAQVFFGYISNFGGNSVLVYESGPAGTNGIGLDNILGEVPDNSQAGDIIDIIEPRGMAYDPDFNPQGLLASGVYLAHRDAEGNGIISRIQFTWQATLGPILRNPPPGYFQPPGFADRRFEVVTQWGTGERGRLAGQVPATVATTDLWVEKYRSQASPLSNWEALASFAVGIGANTEMNCKHPITIVSGAVTHTYKPDRVYVGFADVDVIQVIDPENGGVILKTIEGATGPVGGIYSYFTQ